METAIDRLARKSESLISHYIDHADELYRPLLNFAALIYFFSSISTAVSLVRIWALVSPWMFASLAVNCLLILLSQATRSRLSAKRDTAITLFAAWLVLNLFSLHLIFFCLGVALFVTRPFREMALPFAPAWYRSLIAQLFA